MLCKFLIATSAFCVNTTSQEQKENKEEHEHASASTMQLNNGAKWKADSTTLVNVSAIAQLVNDSIAGMKK